MTLKLGDIVTVELPRPAGRVGREQIGLRPAIVAQDEQKFGSLPTTLVVPITSKQAALRFSGTFPIEPSALNGLNQKSIVLAFQLRAIDRSRIRSTIGRLSDDDLKKLTRTIKDLLAL